MIFNYLKQYRPSIKHQIDLREAISILRPKPDFELFISNLLKEYGYDVIPNQLVMGKCVEHEIDSIAKKNDETILVEVKHHFLHHTFTGLHVFLETWATFEDLCEGKNIGKNNFDFKKVLVICNTKISDHAKQYAECRGIFYMGWNYPVDRGLEQMIEEKRLYPITFLKSLDKGSLAKFGDNGIVMLSQLLKYDISQLQKMTRINKDKLKGFVEKAKKILAS
jgi:hypothetical protein